MAVSYTHLDVYKRQDMIIGCAGGGSNLGGLIAPFMGEKLRGEADYEFIAVEPASCPSLTRGRYVYDFCDTGKVCPLAKMYTLGSCLLYTAKLKFYGGTLLSFHRDLRFDRKAMLVYGKSERCRQGEKTKPDACHIKELPCHTGCSNSYMEGERCV